MKLILAVLLVMVLGGCDEKKCEKHIGWGPINPNSLNIVVGEYDCKGFTGKYWENPEWVGSLWNKLGMFQTMDYAAYKKRLELGL